MKQIDSQGGRITALEPQKRRPDRVSLFLDGRFVCGLSEEVAYTRGLAVGKDVTEAELQELLGDEETRRARDAAFTLLSYRARSRREIENRLLQKGYAASLVKQVTDDLASVGLLDDTEFAESWIRNRQQSRPRGKSYLRWELRQKGVSKETTDAALDALPPEDEAAAALTLARRYLEREKGSDPAALKRRVIAYLQRRGYSWEIIREALASLETLQSEEQPWEES